MGEKIEITAIRLLRVGAQLCRVLIEVNGCWVEAISERIQEEDGTQLHFQHTQEATELLLPPTAKAQSWREPA